MTQSVMKNLPSMLWILFNPHLCCLYPPISLGSITYPSTYLSHPITIFRIVKALPCAAKRCHPYVKQPSHRTPQMTQIECPQTVGGGYNILYRTTPKMIEQ